MITIPNCPSASTEITVPEGPVLRTAFLLADVCHMRVQCEVITPVAGARITIKYSINGGSSWLPVSPGGSGPYVLVSTTGSRQGNYTNIRVPAKGDVLLSVFVSGGDNTSTLVLGNVSALVLAKSNYGDCLDIDDADGLTGNIVATSVVLGTLTGGTGGDCDNPEVPDVTLSQSVVEDVTDSSRSSWVGDTVVESGRSGVTAENGDPCSVSMDYGNAFSPPSYGGFGSGASATTQASVEVAIKYRGAPENPGNDPFGVADEVQRRLSGRFLMCTIFDEWFVSGPPAPALHCVHLGAGVYQFSIGGGNMGGVSSIATSTYNGTFNIASVDWFSVHRFRLDFDFEPGAVVGSSPGGTAAISAYWNGDLIAQITYGPDIASYRPSGPSSIFTGIVHLTINVGNGGFKENEAACSQPIILKVGMTP